MKHRFIILFITMLTFQVSISAQNNNSSNEPEGNGCGSENSLGSPDVIEFLEPIGSRDFKNSCNQHDKDYATPGVSKKKLMKNFVQTCIRTAKNIQIEITWIGIMEEDSPVQKMTEKLVRLEPIDFIVL